MAFEQPVLQGHYGQYGQDAETVTAPCDDMTTVTEYNFDGPSPAQFSASKTGLRSIFSRSKSHRAGGVSGARAEHSALSREPSNQLPILQEDSLLPQSLSSGARVITTSPLDSGPPVSKRTSWNPPPLFQAYPQALKFATLDASCLSVESILHMNAYGEPAGAESAPAESRDSGDTKKKAKRHPSTSIGCGQWTRKLYLLVTSGYLLQYAGEGHHDRLPEKILELGSQSVAFASDAIPGRHWVLQVSHDPESNDENLVVAARSVWSRFGFRAASQKKLAKTFLLICESPEELESWLNSVRKEIEALGGAKHRSDTPSADQSRPTLEHKLSQRFQIQRDPHQFSKGIATETELPERGGALTFTPLWEYQPLPEIKTHSVLWIEQPFARNRDSIAGSSLVTTTDLDNLRDSSNSNTTMVTATRTSMDGSTSSLLPANDRSPISSALLNTRPTITAPLVQVRPSTKTTQGLAVEATALSPEEFPSELDTSTGEGTDLVLGPLPVKQRPVSGAPNFSLPTPTHRLSRASLIMSESSSRSSLVSTEVGLVAGVAKLPTEETDIPVDIEETQPQRPRSTIAPLPSRDAIIKLTRHRAPSAENVVPPILAQQVNPAAVEDGTLRPQITAKKYQTTTPTAPYNLSARRHSAVGYSTFTAPPPPPAYAPPQPPVPGSHQQSSPTPLNDPAGMQDPPAPRKLRRPASVQIEVIKYFASEKPERSPHVTAARFATNVGTAPPSKRSSSASVSATSVTRPSTSRVTFQVRPKHSTRTSPRRRASSSGLGVAIGPPAGPPPSWPLPAVPVGPRAKGAGAGCVSPTRVYLDLTTSDWE